MLHKIVIDWKNPDFSIRILLRTIIGDELMKRALKITGFSLLGVLGVLYLAFLFILPNVIDLDNYMPTIKTLVKEQFFMDLEIKNPKIITTPLLEAGLKADGLKITLPDGSVFVNTGKLKAKVALPSIMLLTAKVSCLNIESPNITIDTNEQATQYKFVSVIEDILNRANTEPKEETEQSWFNPKWIKIKVTNVKLSDYKISVNDLKSGHNLMLKGDEMRLAYNNGKTAKIKTYAYLMSDNKENVTVNIDWNSFFPKKKKDILDEEDDRAEKIDIRFVNIVQIYQNYDLKAHINTRLRLRKTIDKHLTLHGFFNIEDLTLKLSNYRLPECYFHSKIFGRHANLDTSFYVTPEERANILGKIDLAKPSIDLNINSDQIHLNNLIMFAHAFLDSFGIKNDLGNLKGQGYLKADAYIKTNFKKLKSDGKILIRDGSIINSPIGLFITNINSDLLFDESVFKINNTKLFVSGKPFVIDGKIDNKSKADVIINTKDMPITGLYRAFAPNDIKKVIHMSSGNISLDAKINGKLQKSLSTIKFNLKNLGVNTADNSAKINNGDLNITALYDLKEEILKGNITNKNFAFALPQLNSLIKDNLLSIDFNNDLIKINPTNIMINTSSTVKTEGTISDYMKTPIIDIKGNGNLLSSDLRRFAGGGAPYIDAKGFLPLKFKLMGNDKKQYLIAQVLSNPQNLLTPVYFRSLIGKQCITQAKIAYKGDRLNIKDTGLYITHNPFGDDLTANMTGAEPVFKMHGTFARLNTVTPRINVFKINIPKNLSGNIYALKQSTFDLSGNVSICGAFTNIAAHGGINIDNIKLPTLLTNIKSAGLDMNGHSMKLFAKDISLNGSDMNFEANSNFEFLPVMKLNKVDVNSDNFDVDKAMAVANAATKALPQSTSSSSAKAGSDEIPIEATGKFLFRHIKTGNIELKNTRGKLGFAHNTVTLRPMMTNVFKGVVRGKIGVNIISGAINMDLKGHNIDVAQALLDAANTKDAISGTASFDIKAGLKGSTYEEQMKSLSGRTNFKLINGSFGPIGRIENMILAENIRESQFFQTALGGIIKNIATIDTAHFSELKGTINFKNGKAVISPITSQGNVMCLHIDGDFDILKNEADMKVRGRLGSFLSSMLGPISALNPVNIVKATPGINVVMAKAFSLFTVAITQEEMNLIPDFNKSQPDISATKFQIILRGDASKPLAMIKSFKWLALQSDIDTAQNFTDNLPEEYLLADPTTPEAQAAAEAKAKEDAKLKNKIKRALHSKKEE